MAYTYSSAHLLDETTTVQELLNYIDWDDDIHQQITAKARTLITSIRGQSASLTEVEQFLARYPLTSPQGLALMTLAESLLRIPDADTANKLIHETLAPIDWSAHGGGDDLFGKTIRMALGTAQKISSSSFLGNLGQGALRASISAMVKHLGSQFVIGETINDAVKHARALEQKHFRMSYDMLGEGARTNEDAARYFQNYKHAISELNKTSNKQTHPTKNAGISVKLSALHPRYHWSQRDVCLPIMIARVTELCMDAMRANICVTIDAEEADRLELSFEIIESIMANENLKPWHGLGMAIQAYDKRCFYVIDHIISMTRAHTRKLQIRLVKGAYWDTEIKRAQVAGLKNYPVFTRKINTDISYIACAQKLLSHPHDIYPMFATHNAYTAACILTIAPDDANYEFQRLYGMGNVLADILRHQENKQLSVYAPVGSYEDLLPYLVRRMLENGANTSFVQQIRDVSTPINDLIHDPIYAARTITNHKHASIPLPRDLYGVHRLNSHGIDLSHSETRDKFLSEIEQVKIDLNSSPQISIDQLFLNARAAHEIWDRTDSNIRANYIRSIADLIEQNTPAFIKILQTEGKKTIYDAIAEIRETIDFARYYATEGEKIFAAGGTILTGPTGEDNILLSKGRGVFVAISPWNFPLAIFAGQIFAAMMAGNAVIAKPAEQTPRIADAFMKIITDSKLPNNVIQIIHGDGDIGAQLVGHKYVDGVVFTGSTHVAKLIERSLASKDGAIVPLIAETGGQNAMIVDTSALHEHVVDDVLQSAFGSAGQRCSALRVLYLPHENTDKIITMLKGALDVWRTGDPTNWAHDMGALIDNDAHAKIKSHCDKLISQGKLIYKSPIDQNLNTPYIPAHIFELNSITELDEEIFGPVLHIIRYDQKQIDQVIHDINATNYGLTFGVHSRLKEFHHYLATHIKAGNIYVNRSMIGAVVGVQPFGGRGLSGTGPKAGGPHYLHRFATEQTISINTTAAGGNLKLLTLPDHQN
jgi:RHH-type proline utilization regulon transcriptional repressor/proline dehydrogenase/delta 1-pyrroline-5-carboxylate dehydrogenase